MLQNRVDPFGQIIKASARGAWMGNRGLLHDDTKQLRRNFRLKAWITCKLEFKGRKRTVMAPNRYTELFFLDEATGFSAGHRPCFECRRSDYKRFKSLWLEGNPEYAFEEGTPIDKIDAVLHRERLDEHNRKPVFEENIDQIPDGAFVLLNGQAFLFFNRLLHAWSPERYEKSIPLPPGRTLNLLTPRSFVNTFRAGYRPQVHPSANI